MSRPRRFTLLDVMILVAATAPAMLLWRAYLRCNPALPYLVSDERGPSKLRMWVWVCGLVPPLAVLTLALLPIRWIPPRPRPRRLLRRPGTTTSLVAALAWAVVLARVVGDWPMMIYVHIPTLGPIQPVDLLTLRLVGMKDMVGPGVALSWALLWLGGGRRPEATWIDRAGRIAGAAWVALGLASWIISLLER